MITLWSYHCDHTTCIKSLQICKENLRRIILFYKNNVNETYFHELNNEFKSKIMGRVWSAVWMQWKYRKNDLDLLLLIHKKVFQNKFHLQKINCIFKKYFLDHFLGSFCFSALRAEGAACQRADSCVQARKLLELL